jgi:uncharacterized Fe-S cluster-containing MiaB family protein
VVYYVYLHTCRDMEFCVIFGMEGCKIRYIDVMNGMMCGYNANSPYRTVNNLDNKTDQQVRIALNKTILQQYY